MARRYPRIPHLVRTESVDRTDGLVPADEVPSWLQHPVVVEEKLDGANVSIWLQDGALQVGSRGGADAVDRAGQLGPLRAHVHRYHDIFRSLLAPDTLLYAEWLWFTHTIEYDRLPDHLVCLDLWSAERGFVPVTERDRRCRQSGLALPPRLFDGVLGSLGALRQLMGRSRFGSGPMEGVVLRRDDGARCKLLREGFRPAPGLHVGERRNVVARPE